MTQISLLIDEHGYLKSEMRRAIERCLAELQEAPPNMNQIVFNLNLATEIARQLVAVGRADSKKSVAKEFGPPGGAGAGENCSALQKRKP
ncbi:hypothetical protein [Rhodoferax sp.]|uniref:hypothetical protein n=1 Tax=Rhodoferax sp. TaxID=50421 RepID=UPI00261D82EA|nr:hypothetical protein [Rhodoferax sp.]MDD3937678.1 hypothetical protein [Rhodoferax sp.]